MRSKKNIRPNDYWERYKIEYDTWQRTHGWRLTLVIRVVTWVLLGREAWRDAAARWRGGRS